MHLCPIDTCKPETNWVFKIRRIKIQGQNSFFSRRSLWQYWGRSAGCQGATYSWGRSSSWQCSGNPALGSCPVLTSPSQRPSPGVIQQILKLWQPLSCSCRCIWCHTEAQSNVPQSCSATVAMDSWARTPRSASGAIVEGKTSKAFAAAASCPTPAPLSSSITDKNTQLTVNPVNPAGWWFLK